MFFLLYQDLRQCTLQSWKSSRNPTQKDHGKVENINYRGSLDSENFTCAVFNHAKGTLVNMVWEKKSVQAKYICMLRCVLVISLQIFPDLKNALILLEICHGRISGVYCWALLTDQMVYKMFSLQKLQRINMISLILQKVFQPNMILCGKGKKFDGGFGISFLVYMPYFQH